MAYDSKSLSVLAYANGFTLWHYGTDDTDGTPSNGMFAVNANAAGVVDVADLTAFGGSDTD